MSFKKTFEKAYTCTVANDMKLAELKECKENILKLKVIKRPSDFKHYSELDDYIDASATRISSEILFQSNVLYNTELTTKDMFKGNTALLYRRKHETGSYQILYNKVNKSEKKNNTYSMMSILQNKKIKQEGSLIDWAVPNFIFAMFIILLILVVKYLFSDIGYFVTLKGYLSYIGDMEEEEHRINLIIDRLNYEQKYNREMTKKDKKTVMMTPCPSEIKSDIILFKKYKGKIKSIYKDKIWKNDVNIEKSKENLKNLLNPE